MSKISELSDGGVVQGGDTLIAVRSGGNVKVTYGGSTTANIDGGTIDDTVIGGTTAAAGTFTTGQFDTSVNVTGTVTADGLVVAGDAFISSANARLRLFETDTTDLNTQLQNQAGDFNLSTLVDNASASTLRLKVDHSTGDISFYEDTGTTAKLFWDASAERLGIGTSNPNFNLDVRGTSDVTIRAQNTTDGVATLSLRNVGSNDLFLIQEGGATKFFHGAQERLRLESDGDISFYENTGTTAKLFWDASAERLGIGTTSPATVIDARQTTTGGDTQIRLFNTDNSNTTTQTAAVFLSPDSRSNGALISGVKENADFSTNAGRDVALVFSPVVNNAATERARITSDGFLRMASGSGGIQFNGDTAAANALDDYEEGTWTPSDGSGAGLTLTVTNARYTKVGNTVFVTAQITYPATVDVTPAIISGLPFVVSAGGSGAQSIIASNSFADKGLFVGSQSQIFIYAAASTLQSTNAQLSGAVLFGVSGTYTV